MRLRTTLIAGVWAGVMATAPNEPVIAADPSARVAAPAVEAFDQPATVATNAPSVLSRGDAVRLQHAFVKAIRGEKVVLGVIGGSITQGACASTPQKRYADCVAAWWRKAFPKATIELVNAGIGSTASNYGALRAQRDLLVHQPDVVIIEYGVNDWEDKHFPEQFEGLIRQILTSPRAPAALLLFMMNEKGQSAQNVQAKVGAHYGLPMISYRDELWPELEAKRLKWSDISPDDIHPNDRGHEYAARFVIAMLDKALKTLPEHGEVQAVRPLPGPLYSDCYEHTTLLEGAALKPVSQEGWTYSNGAWKSAKSGSVIEFDMEGRIVLSMHWVGRGDTGCRAQMQVDEGPMVVRDASRSSGPADYRVVGELARDLQPGRHRVRVTLLADTSTNSTGNPFQILGFGVAGMAESKVKAGIQEAKSSASNDPQIRRVEK